MDLGPRWELGTHGKILLVGEDQQAGVAQLVLVQHALKLLTGLDDTIAIVAVDDEDDTLGVLEVVPPQRTNLVLATDIPHGERNVPVLDGLDVEAFIEQLSTSKGLVCGMQTCSPWGHEVTGRDVPMVGMVVTISPSFSL